MSVTKTLEIAVVIFLVGLPIFLIFAEMWSFMSPIVTNQTITGNNASVSAKIQNLGDSFFYYSGDTILVLLYFAMIAGLFISAIYEAARPETLPIGLLFMIPLIIITLPLSDLSHWFYMSSGFSNVAHYYTATEYLADNSPLLTALFTLAYLVFVSTKKQINASLFGGSSGGGGGNVVSG